MCHMFLSISSLVTASLNSKRKSPDTLLITTISLMFLSRTTPSSITTPTYETVEPRLQRSFIHEVVLGGLSSIDGCTRLVAAVGSAAASSPTTTLSSSAPIRFVSSKDLTAAAENKNGGEDSNILKLLEIAVASVDDDNGGGGGSVRYHPSPFRPTFQRMGPMRWGCCGSGDPKAVPCESRIVNHKDILPTQQQSKDASHTADTKSDRALESLSFALHAVTNDAEGGGKFNNNNGVWAVLAWLLALQSDRCWMHPEPFYSQQQHEIDNRSRITPTNSNTPPLSSGEQHHAVHTMALSTNILRSSKVHIHGCDSPFIRDLLFSRTSNLKIGLQGLINCMEEVKYSTTSAARCSFSVGAYSTTPLTTTGVGGGATPLHRFIFTQQPTMPSHTTSATYNTIPQRYTSSDINKDEVFPASYPCCGGGKMVRGCALDASYLAQIGLLTITTDDS